MTLANDGIYEGCAVLAFELSNGAASTTVVVVGLVFVEVTEYLEVSLCI